MMKTHYALPPPYSRYAVIDPSKDHRFIAGAVLAGIVLFIGCGWLLVQLANSLRPAALDGIRLRDMLVSTPTGTALHLPSPLFRDVAIALVAVLFLHELAHGLFYWWFSGRRPKFGLKGLFPYAASPAGVYYPRNRFLAVGLAPLAVLTLLGLPILLAGPAAVAPVVLFALTFNAAGSAGDLLMVARLLSFPANMLMEDRQAGIAVYGPGAGS